MSSKKPDVPKNADFELLINGTEPLPNYGVDLMLDYSFETKGDFHRYF
jgi:hypothetical protein